MHIYNLSCFNYIKIGRKSSLNRNSGKLIQEKAKPNPSNSNLFWQTQNPFKKAHGSSTLGRPFESQTPEHVRGFMFPALVGQMPQQR